MAVAAYVPARNAIRTRTGRRINWRKPPKPNTIVTWKHQGRTFKGSLRTICHMARLNSLARAQFGVEIVVLQGPYNTSVRASAGTHDKSEVWDIYIPGVPWRTQERWLRARGFACWYRFPPAFGYHIHGFTLPEREGRSIGDDFKAAGLEVGVYVDGGWSTRGAKVTSSQIDDYYNHAFGLSSQHVPGSDKAWYPKDIAKTIFDLRAFVAGRVKEVAHDEYLGYKKKHRKG